MTNKTLSEQICEVCGIEPQIIKDYNSNEYKIYPDFENNNNNFVKLLEIYYDCKNIKKVILNSILNNLK